MQNIKSSWLVLFAFSGMMVLASLFLQFFIQMHPCSLCILSRVAVILITILSLAAWLINPQRFVLRLFFWGTIFVSTLFGIVVSVRHVWLLSLPPDQAPACGPGLNYLLDTLPLHQVIVEIFQGSGECAKTLDLILGVPLAHWTLLAFIVLLGMQLWMLRKLFKGQKKGG